MSESTNKGERAIQVESTKSRERDNFPESTKVTEPSESESTMSGERAKW